MTSVFRILGLHQSLYSGRLHFSTKGKVLTVERDGKLDALVRKGGWSETLCTLGVCIHTVLRAQSLR